MRFNSHDIANGIGDISVRGGTGLRLLLIADGQKARPKENRDDEYDREPKKEYGILPKDEAKNNSSAKNAGNRWDELENQRIPEAFERSDKFGGLRYERAPNRSEWNARLWLVRAEKMRW